MNYRSIDDLAADVVRGLHRLPKDVDVVVGIPRSGMLAASLIALALNVPLADLEGFAEGRLLSAGSTRRRKALDARFADLRHALVVDDSIYSGRSIARARERLAGVASPTKVTYMAVYGLPNSAPHADLIFETVPDPRIFQWNIMHHDTISNACVDFDGILCVDPSHAENDDGEAYLRFLTGAAPLYLPTRKIGAIVTSRLEKYRPQTEAWLADHGVEYGELIMLDLPDAETRRRLGAHGTFKADVYRRSDASIFIESEIDQARKIADLSGKDVICFADHTVYRPGALSVAGNVRLAGETAKGMRHFARRLVRRAARVALGRA